MKYYIVNNKFDAKLFNYNKKAQNVRQCLLKNCINIDCESPDTVINFINQNNDNKEICLIIFQLPAKANFVNMILDCINRYTSIEMRIVFFTFDYWYMGDLKRLKYYNSVLYSIYYAKNHHVITFAKNLSHLEEAHDKDYQKYKNKIIHANIWSCYDTSFIQFNESPILKICVSGAVACGYPERQQIVKLKDVVKLSYEKSERINMNNNYNKRLNQYICCFASSPHVMHLRNNKQRKNTNLLVLKYFEILASGALLLTPSTEEEQLAKIGVYHKKNCYLSSIDNMQEAADYILNPVNRHEIDTIRRKGQEHAREELNTDKKYAEIMGIIKNICEP